MSNSVFSCRPLIVFVAPVVFALSSTRLHRKQAVARFVMMWTSVTQEQIDQITVQAFLPIVLLLNYSLLLYLAIFYWKRRGERRVMLLLFVGALGTVAIIPFARPDPVFVGAANDLSEACCVLTFLLQITIIGYDLNKKFKIRSVMYLTYAAEVLILGDLVAILISCIVTVAPRAVSNTMAESISNAAENANLAFIFIFRFYYIGISRGWRSIAKSRKLEVCSYILFATHELPFNLVSSASGLNWEFAQAIWHRTTLMTCLLITARTKIKRLSGAVPTSIARTNASSVSSDREKGNGSRRLSSLRGLLYGKVPPGLDVLIRKSGGSGDRRGLGPQIYTVAPIKQLDDLQPTTS